MIKASLHTLDLKFINPGNTSRGVLYSKPSWFIKIEKDGNTGIGECSVIPDLNPEYDENYQDKLNEIVSRLNDSDIPKLSELDDFVSIRFGLETAMLDLMQPPQGILFPSAFTEGEEGIPINGLIWMGNIQQMQQQISDKLKLGFRVLKLKVGAINFDQELELLRNIREHYSDNDLEIRLDANGAFAINDCIEKLNRLAEHKIHSIEQPIKPGNIEAMAEICASSPIPVALDEELIGVPKVETKKRLLEQIRPHHIILKPSLTGGFEKCMEWIDIAKKLKIGWWVTSALESNIGLNAIAQWTYTLQPKMAQGLGTGQLFSNNIDTPLILDGPNLYYRSGRNGEKAPFKILFT